MSLIKHTSTIAGFTVISRIFGFARDMILARVLGAGLAADAYQLAFTLPNTFRRLFAEGAFSVAFVPMYSRKLAGESGEAEAETFASDVLSVFLWVLLVFSALAMIAMPIIVYGLASEYLPVFHQHCCHAHGVAQCPLALCPWGDRPDLVQYHFDQRDYRRLLLARGQ
jgi:putative peptidoglycan lipid II flippase